jgi:hypothetical protein
MNAQSAQEQAIHVERKVGKSAKDREVLYDVHRRPESRAVEAVRGDSIKKLLNGEVGNDEPKGLANVRKVCIDAASYTHF